MSSIFFDFILSHYRLCSHQRVPAELHVRQQAPLFLHYRQCSHQRVPGDLHIRQQAPLLLHYRQCSHQRVHGEFHVRQQAPLEPTTGSLPLQQEEAGQEIWQIECLGKNHLFNS